MTNKLEKQFFDTFNIEPIGCNDNKNCTGVLDCTQCPNAKYPQITDRILLELICILTKSFDYADQNWLTKCNNTKELKVSVLRLLLLYPTSIIEEYKYQVRTLFEEEN